ncbi:hypothetical protein QMK19_28895 [Streptomyces sp. H10-C2]|uniref:hypothetical protein n=1 Tax=Streptomyces TaxID=1883 RepID=UPI0018E05BE3|nr:MULTISPECIES: hypothetical protein [Streptomyces]MDJ0344228.1 hypothetical protein [Streptomyces sp. PH10-H1]MDJ0373566.1 hypothetical protein [Streptomyces sp. H10-C2]
MPKPTADQVPAWPCYQLTAADDGTVTLSGPLTGPGPYPGRAEAVAAVAAAITGAELPRPVRAQATDADGTVWPLIISPTGEVSEAGDGRRTKTTKRGKRGRVERPRTATPGTPPPAPIAVTPPEPTPVPQLVPGYAPSLSTPPEPAPKPVAPEPAPPRTATPDTTPAAPQLSAPAVRSIPDPRVPAPATYLRIRAAVEAGAFARALALAAELDESATRVHGPSHPAALGARETRAHVAAESGQLAAAVVMYAEVAERWSYKKDNAAAHEAAKRAHALWLTIQNPDEAAAVGAAVLRMRQIIPGEKNTAYLHAQRHLKELDAATRDSTAVPQQR